MGIRRIRNGKSRTGVKVVGTCCVQIFEKRHYRGRSQKLPVGYDDLADFSHIRSIKFGVCSDL